MDPAPKVNQGAQGTQGGDAPVEVLIHHMAFDPRDVVIRAGQSVRWINKDSPRHTVLSNPGVHGCQPPSPEDFASYALETGMAYEYRFTKPGTYHYYCLMHGCAMSGSVTVT
jgi:plastocyanin